MLKCMLETNIVIYTMKNRPQTVKLHFQKNHGHGRMAIYTVTLGELGFCAEY